MGNVVDKCLGRQRSERKINLLLVGLDNAGKTKTANNLTGQSDREVCPTVGFRAYNLVHKRYPVVIYDLGGSSGFRGIWEQYYSDVHGVIFVVDSTDIARLDECRDALKTVLSHEKISGKPVLILANKQDVEGALDDVNLVERLDIEAVVNRYRCPTTVEAYTAAPVETNPKQKKKMDPGLRKGYTWLLNYITHKYGDLNLRVQTDINADKTRRQMKMTQKEIGTITDETLTSFENPNYTGKIEADVNPSTSPDGVIVVKEASTSKSIDYDAIEVAETIEDKPKDNEKLSSLFGDKLENGNVDQLDSKPIELEARTKVRKLSPIVRGRFTVTAHGDERIRPQTSPSAESKKEVVGDYINASRGTSIEKLSPERGERNGSGRVMEVGLVETEETGGPLSGRRQVLPPIGKINNNNVANSNNIASSPLSWDTSTGSKSATPTTVDLNSTPPPARRTTHAFLKSSSQEDSEMEDHSKGDGRPQSATQGVRKQLEKTKDTLKKKLSIKSLRRNRTSPEIQSSLFSYDPASSKTYDHQQVEGGAFSAKTKNYGRVGLRSDTVM